MEGERKRMGLRGSLYLILALLVLYPLSFGPAAWMLNKLEPDGSNPILDRIFTAFYRPLSWVVYDTAMQGWLAQYLSWFVPEDF